MESINKQVVSLETFTEGNGYVDALRMYFSHFQKMPLIKSIERLQNAKLCKWIEAEWKHKIVVQHHKQEYDWRKNKLQYSDVFYVLNSGILINLTDSTAVILYDNEQETEATEILNHFKKFKNKKRKTQDISLVISTKFGLGTNSLSIKKPVLDLGLHYNDDLQPIHGKILSALKQNKKSGLYLFHGIPGTGKSTYIRYLIRSICKKVIFISPRLAENLDTPEFTSLLISNANTVFVIEDAEGLLGFRNLAGNSGISTLLNLTDGLLGESLGIQIIATFNTDLQNIDKALLRKGRLIALYDFKPLTIERSVALLRQTGCKDYPVKGPMTLAEIFNVKEENYNFAKSERQAIGFYSAAV